MEQDEAQDRVFVRLELIGDPSSSEIGASYGYNGQETTGWAGDVCDLDILAESLVERLESFGVPKNFPVFLIASHAERGYSPLPRGYFSLIEKNLRQLGVNAHSQI